MNKRDNLLNSVENALMILTHAAQNWFLSVKGLLKIIFHENDCPESRLLLPSGTGNLLNSGTGKDFYAMPIRIIRKSL